MQLKKNEGWQVGRISRKQALEFSLRHHSWIGLPSVVWAYHLSDAAGNICGMAIYSMPSSPDLYKIFPDCEPDEVMQLSRLVLISGLAKNAGSYLLSKSIKLVKQDYSLVYMIVTYCEQNTGNEGTVYRASNWQSYGDSADGSEYVSGGFRMQIRKNKNAEGFQRVKRVLKKRFVICA